MIACEERKQRRFVGVKMSWSIATRVRIVALEEGFPFMIMRRWRKENQVVAAGPKIAMSHISLSLDESWRREGELTTTVKGHSSCSF